MRISILGRPEHQWRTKSPRSFGQSRVRSGVDEIGTRGQIGQKPKNNMAASGVVKVLVSFYRSGEDSAFKRHRSRVTFDLGKQSSVARCQETSDGISWAMKEFVVRYRPVRQRTVHSETTKERAGALPPAVYRKLPLISPPPPGYRPIYL